MRFALGTFFLCVAISCFLYALQMIGERMTPAYAEHVSSFNEQLALSPGMFDDAKKGDRLHDQEAELKGGVLTPDEVRRVNTILFLKELGCRRLRELGGAEQCP